MSITKESQPFRFTRENAREMSARSWQARRERKAKLEAEAAMGRMATPQSEMVAQEIERLLDMMSKSKDADTIQKLSSARSRLFSEWQVLTATPNPGSLKSRRHRPSPTDDENPAAVPLD